MAASGRSGQPGSTDQLPASSRCSALEGAVDTYVQEVRAAGGEAALESGGDVRRLLDELTRHAERPREPGEVDGGVHQVHADVAVVLGGEALEGQGALLENAVGGVVEDHVDDRDRVVRRRPEGLVRVHGAAVADE